MAKKINILYWMFSNLHARLYSAMQESGNVNQLIAILDYKQLPNMDLHLPIQKYNSPSGFTKIIKRFKPDVTVMSVDSAEWLPKIKQYGSKVVYAYHGVWDTVSAANRRHFDSNYWNQFDLICGATNGFAQVMNEHYKVPMSKIKTNMLLQLDLLHKLHLDKQRCRANVIKRTGIKNVDKIITIFGHHVGKATFVEHNSGYINSIINLSRVAKKNNWLIVIKPKRKMTIKTRKFFGECFDEVIKNPNVFFAEITDNQYEYMVASDAVICSARSTMEIEACAAQIPLGLIRDNFHSSIGNDSLGTISSGSAVNISNVNDIEQCIFDMIGNEDIVVNQKKYIEELGLSFDGKAHVRLQNAAIDLVR